MKNSIYKIWLYLFIFFSLFSGLPLNGICFFGYHFTFIGGPEVFLEQYKIGSIKWSDFLNWLVMLISHLSILAFPFFFNKISYFKLLLIFIPLIFLITQYHIMGPFIFTFFPFMIIWLILLIVKPKPLLV